jgi:HSP20 family protein
MQLVRTNSRRNQLRCQNNADRIFDGFFDDFAAPFFNHNLVSKGESAANLQVDIYEKGNSIVIEAEMPGVNKNEINLDVKGKLVTLGYERKSSEEVKEDQHYRRERRYGKFERTFSMPFEIDADSVQARYEDGVLKLEMEKPQQQQKQQIEIQ